MNGIEIDQAALDEAIRTDPILAEVEESRRLWKRLQLAKADDWTAKIHLMQEECKPLLRAVRAAEAALRKQRAKIDRAKRARLHNFRQLRKIDKKETARLRFLRMRAVNTAIAEARRLLAKEHKVSALV